MNLEGLDAILNKEEIVQTQRPSDLVDRSEMVDRAYTNHVRSYIPLGREAQGDERAQSVTDFERKVVRAVKDAAALRGYITAEYGYGKTSTALYLWKQAREENILAVPPFVMTQLPDLITATYGWLIYELERTRPGSSLLNEAESLYRTITNRSAENLASVYNMDWAGAQQLIKDRPEMLNLNTADYLRFFEKATKIAREAGFGGILILADEVQQYVDPEVKTGVKDPISPLFELVSGLITRRNHLHFGLILVLPPKELDVLRDQRGDLIHRMLQASLDLRTVYNREFPARLWYRLAEQFNFENHSHRIVSDSTLDSLGQIAARFDLSDGPRTVVNTFRQMTRRYLDLGSPGDDPYTPEHFINDFLHGQITFDSSKKIPQVTNQALGHSLVKGYPDRERAVKWAAAFPEEGVPRNIQEELGLLAAFDALLESAQGDLVISVGDVKNRGVTLRGLDRVEQSKDTISVMTREFWRLYGETERKTRDRATRGFLELLKEKVFPGNQWQVEETREEELLTRNQGLIVKGSFTSYNRKYPDRRIHVQLLWEDESVKDISIDGDILIQIRLKCYFDKSEAGRREYSVPVEFDYEARQLNLTLNLMHQDETNVSPNLEQAIGAIVSPYKFTPLLMLALHEFLNEKRAKNLIPKNDDQQIRYMFQPDLLDHVFRFLFNAEVGRPVDAAQERILEEATRSLFETIYPDYHTLMLVGNWTSSLGKYRNALKHLETTHERQGQMVVQGTKDEIAELFTLSNTGLDTVINTFDQLVEIRQSFPTQREAREGKKGAVLFQLHPLEQQIKKWLMNSPQTSKHKIGQQTHTVHTIPTNEVYQKANALGYHNKEIDEILSLMEDRGLIAQDRRGTIREEINQAPSIDELATNVEEWQRDITKLQEVFDQSQLRSWQTDGQKFRGIVENLRKKPDDEKAITARRAVQTYRRQLDEFIKDRHQDLINSLNQFGRSLPQPNPQHLKNLSTPIQGRVNYVEQVNDVRTRVRHQVETLKSETDQYRQQVEAVAAALVKDTLSIEALVKLAKEYKSLQGKSNALQSRCEERAKDFDRFNEWGRLVELGSALLDQIQELGEAVQPEKEKFQKLSQDIRGHLSARKTDALPDAPTYENQIREIAENVRKIKSEANDRFTRLQDRYRQTLTGQLKFPADRLWSPYPYNPANPNDSYQRLINEVQDALQKLCRRLQEQVKQLQEKIQFTLQSPLLKVAEDKDDIESRGQTLLAQFDDLSEQLSKIQLKLNNPASISDFPEEGTGVFHQFVDMFTPVLKTLTSETPKEVQRLSSRIKDIALEPDEEMVLTNLPKSEDMEFSDLRRRVNLSEDQLWKALRGLYTKRRIRLPIKSIPYE